MKKAIYLILTTLLLTSCSLAPEDIIVDPTLADFRSEFTTAWGTAQADDFTGAVQDQNGNLYITGVSNPDGYKADIFLTKIDLVNNAKIWSKSFDFGYQDFVPSPSENGRSQGGGGAHSINIDADGNLYLVGTTKQTINKVFAMKVNSEGEILWQKSWQAADSDLVKSSAKAYASLFADGTLFVTGSTGGGDSNEEAKAFILALNPETGATIANQTYTIDLSPGYNDRGYVLKQSPAGRLYLAGWEGQDNSGFLALIAPSLDSIEWVKNIDAGEASRIVDIDFDQTNNLYLATDLRGVATYLGVIKMSPAGQTLWSKKFQGEPNDRNNISSIKVADNTVFLGGKGSYIDYDISEWSDGTLIKMDLEGNLLAQYNYFTGSESGNRSGERIEYIDIKDDSALLIGETWPESQNIAGRWHLSTGKIYDMTVAIKNNGDFTAQPIEGVQKGLSAEVSNIKEPLNIAAEKSHGSADVMIYEIEL